jgi:hypothetical protein
MEFNRLVNFTSAFRERFLKIMFGISSCPGALFFFKELIISINSLGEVGVIREGGQLDIRKDSLRRHGNYA